MLVKLINDFHHTTHTIRVADDFRLTRRQVRRAKAALCGMRGCCCSNAIGMRGCVDDDADSGLEFVEHFDGAGHFVRVDRDIYGAAS
jgi:hypothetical protein